MLSSSGLNSTKCGYSVLIQAACTLTAEPLLQHELFPCSICSSDVNSSAVLELHMKTEARPPSWFKIGTGIHSGPREQMGCLRLADRWWVNIFGSAVPGFGFPPHNEGYFME